MDGQVPADRAAARPSRIAGLDAARALAIIGMLMVHVGPTGAPGPYGVSHGRAVVLFLLVAGVGVSLLAASTRTTAAGVRLKLAWRAVLLLPLGLLLQELDHDVLVILQDYAVLFVLAIAVLGLRDRWLLALAAAVYLLGPLVYLRGQTVAPMTFLRTAASISDPPGEILHALILSGPYPLITSAAPFLLGMWLGRRDLRALSARALLIAVGAGIVIVTLAAAAAFEAFAGGSEVPEHWWRLATTTPHSQMPLWLLGASGSALLVLGVALILADALGRWLWPLVATGQMALSVYVAHLLALHRWPDALTSPQPGRALLIVLGMTGVAVVICTGWRAMLPRGPLESLLQLPRCPRRRCRLR